MKQTLRSRLIRWFSARPNEVISGIDMEIMVALHTSYKPSNCSRRLRELANEGILIRTEVKGFAHYQWMRSPTTGIGMKLTPSNVTALATQLKSNREQKKMAKVQLTLV